MRSAFDFNRRGSKTKSYAHVCFAAVGGSRCGGRWPHVVGAALWHLQSPPDATADASGRCSSPDPRASEDPNPATSRTAAPRQP
jgi:hypothetical protein